MQLPDVLFDWGSGRYMILLRAFAAGYPKLKR